jgi:tryptophan-rich sensory protein
MSITKLGRLSASIGVAQLAGLIGSLATFPEIGTWYSTLIKPSFNPPNWIFGPVWTTLYILMGIALYLVWDKGTNKKAVRTAIWVFFIHLVVNCLWSVVFFGLHSLSGGIIVILILLAMIIILMKLFYPINRWAAYLLAPYLLWVSFATVLNMTLWLLNR